jgi:hypothetical protein
LPKGQRWTFLWESIKRFYIYFKAINDGISFPFPKGIDIRDSDMVFAFFILCFHLKDWILKDCDPSVATLVEDYVETSRLKECRAIANGYKHLNADGPDFVGSKIKIFSGENVLTKQMVRFSILDSPREIKDAFVLATDCLNLWHGFIKAHIDQSDSIPQ